MLYPLNYAATAEQVADIRAEYGTARHQWLIGSSGMDVLNAIHSIEGIAIESAEMSNTHLTLWVLYTQNAAEHIIAIHSSIIEFVDLFYLDKHNGAEVSFINTKDYIAGSCHGKLTIEMEIYWEKIGGVKYLRDLVTVIHGYSSKINSTGNTVESSALLPSTQFKK